MSSSNRLAVALSGGTAARSGLVGATFEESLDGVIRVSVVATGVDISSANNARPAVSPHAPASPQGRAA